MPTLDTVFKSLNKELAEFEANPQKLEEDKVNFFFFQFFK